MPTNTPASASQTADPAGSNGVVYLLFVTIGLAAGLWPEAIWPGHAESADPTLPLLQTVVIAQILFALVAYPTIIIRRQLCDSANTAAATIPVIATAREAVIMLLVALPAYVAGWWFSDAVLTSALQSVLHVAAVFACVVLACGADARGGRGGAVVLAMLVMLVIAIGLPAGWYISAEFFDRPHVSDVLWNISPLLRGWTIAAGGAEVSSGQNTPWFAWSAIWVPVGAGIRLVRSVKTRDGALFH